MVLLEARTSMLFIAKANPGSSHYIEFYSLTNFWLFMIFGQTLESRYLCTHKSKITLMISLEAPTRMLFIAKANP